MSMNLATESRTRFAIDDIADTRALRDAETRAASFAKGSGSPALLVYNSRRGSLDHGIVRLFARHGRDFVSTLHDGYIVIPYESRDSIRGDVATLRRRMVEGDSCDEGASIIITAYDGTGSRMGC